MSSELAFESSGATRAESAPGRGHQLARLVGGAGVALTVMSGATLAMAPNAHAATGRVEAAGVLAKPVGDPGENVWDWFRHAFEGFAKGFDGFGGTELMRSGDGAAQKYGDAAGHVKDSFGEDPFPGFSDSGNSASGPSNVDCGNMLQAAAARERGECQGQSSSGDSGGNPPPPPPPGHNPDVTNGVDCGNPWQKMGNPQVCGS